MLVYCQLDTLYQTSVAFESKHDSRVQRNKIQWIKKIIFMHKKTYMNIPGSHFIRLQGVRTCMRDNSLFGKIYQLVLAYQSLGYAGYQIITGPLFTKKTPSYGYRIPIINLRRSDDRLRFIMGIAILIKRRLLSEYRPWSGYNTALHTFEYFFPRILLSRVFAYSTREVAYARHNVFVVLVNSFAQTNCCKRRCKSFTMPHIIRRTQ